MDSKPYLLRFFSRLFAEVSEFMTGQQMISTFLLALVAAAYQFGAKRLTLEAFKQNVASVIYPFVWVVCGVASMHVIKAAVHLYRENLAEWEHYQPSIVGYSPKRPSVAPGIATSVVFLSLFGLVSYWAFELAFMEPVLTLKVRAEAVARLYIKGSNLPAGKTIDVSPSLAELFYEWILEAKPSADVFQVLIKVKSFDKNQDRISVLSDGASISDRQAHWISGFTEPNAPDYWERSISFSALPKGKPITIVLRSPVKLLNGDEILTEEAIKREFNVTCSPCKVQTTREADHAQALVVLNELNHLSEFFLDHNKKKLPIRVDPDVREPDLRLGEYEATVEARCRNEKCELADLSNMIGRIHQMPTGIGPRVQVEKAR